MSDADIRSNLRSVTADMLVRVPREVLVQAIAMSDAHRLECWVVHANALLDRHDNSESEWDALRQEFAKLREALSVADDDLVISVLKVWDRITFRYRTRASVLANVLAIHDALIYFVHHDTKENPMFPRRKGLRTAVDSQIHLARIYLER